MLLIERVPWSDLRVGDLFQSADDMYPLRVLSVLHGGSLLVRVRFTVLEIWPLRYDVLVDRFVVVDAV